MEGIAGLYHRSLLRLTAAFKTVPRFDSILAWACIATFAAVVIPVGLTSGFLQLKVEKRFSKWIQVLFVVFCTRGLAEELVFRVMALPHPAVDGYTSPKDFAVRAMVSTTVFVAAHLLIPGQRQRQTYWDPRFLMMSTMFSAMCSVIYYFTGSLLVIWLLHGVPVAIWLLLLGGAEKVE